MAVSAHARLVDGQSLRLFDGTRFTWSLRKIRAACLLLGGIAMLVAAGFAASGPFLKWACLVCLVAICLSLHRLIRTASANATVLLVDSRGILDSRLMSRRIAWQEIEAICEVDPDRSKVLDIKLRWPAETLRGTKWSVQIGGYCQSGYNVPAVTINMLLLDGSVSEMIDAVALYRPDLLHPTNRRRGRTETLR